MYVTSRLRTSLLGRVLTFLFLRSFDIGSHKRRDNRCGIAAPKLEHAFTVELERGGWEVHTQIDDPSAHGSALEDIQGSDEEKDAEVERLLKELDPRTAVHKRALIVKNSHFGGHKFAGNVVVSTRQLLFYAI